MVDISFNAAGQFAGVTGDGIADLANPTSLQFGPDGRLYVSEQSGRISAFTIELVNGQYVATDHEVLTLPNGGGVVQSIMNHNDDGSLQPFIGNRQVTGILVTGTAANPVLYISSSDPRISTNNDSNLDTNSGVVTRVTWTGTAWEAVDILRGLPRSEENHANNGMTLSPDGTKLYLAVGGNTNNGAPSSYFTYTGEYALSGTVLEIDLVAINNLPIKTDPIGTQIGGAALPRQYIYDLPTLDDPNTPNVNGGGGENASGLDEAGPWGGRDGLNMAILPADAPLSIYADGFRNPYDLVWTQSGNLVTVDNGSNGGLGGYPIIAPNGEATNQPNNGGDGNPEPLFVIEEGGYYGHPAPARSNQNLSWTVYNNSGTADTSLAVNFVADLSALVPASINIQDGFLIDPSKFTGDPARLLESGIGIPYEDPASPSLVNIGSSSNGLVEYTGTAFGGALQGALIVAQFNNTITLLNINDAGTAVEPLIGPGIDGILGNADDVVVDADGVYTLVGGLSTPLDVTVGPGGTIWVAEIGGNAIKVFAPGVADVVLDADGDGLLNVDDPFIRDATNGTGVTLFPGQTLVWDLDPDQDGNLPGPSGFGGGLTGVMIDGTTNYEEFFLEESTLPQQVIKLDNVKFTTAAGGGTTVVEYVSNGDATGTTNTGEYLFHTGFKLAPTVETFTIKWSVVNPLLTSPNQQIGGYIGTGDQSNYLKIVATANPAGEIQILLEDNDVVITNVFLQANNLFTVPVDQQIFFELEIDPAAGTATPTITYEIGGGNTNTVTGSAINLNGTNVLDVILGNYAVQGETTGLAVGLYASNVGATPAPNGSFQAIFTDIEVTGTGDASQTVLYRVNAGGPEIAAIDGGPNWLADGAFLLDPGSNSIASFPAVDPGSTIPPSTPGTIFDTERWDAAGGTEMQYGFAVTPGLYEVRLYLGNGFGGTGTPGTRVFDVSIEGQVLPNLNDIDLAADFGTLVGGLLSNIVQVTDGTLNIEFLHGIENPLVNGIEIIQLGGGGGNDNPAISIVGGPYTVSEATNQVQVSILANQTVPSNETVDVTFQIVPGTATPQTDYVYNSPTATFNAATGTYTDTITIAGSSSDVTFFVNILPDTIAETNETFTVNIVGVSPNAQLGTTTTTTVTILDNDVPVGGTVVAAINAGGPALIQDGISFAADTFFIGGDPYTDGTFDPDQPIFNGTIYETERFGGSSTGVPFSYSIPVAAGNYTVELYFAELFQTTTGSRVFDVTVEGQLVLDNLDILAQTGGDINQPFVFTVPGIISPNTFGATDAIDIAFNASVDNAKVSGIVVRSAATSPAKTVTIAATTQAAEPSTNGLFTVSLSQTSTTNTVVAYSVAGTATAGTDYTALTGTVTILAGQLSATIPVTVIDDTAVEGAESIIVTLTGVTGAADIALGTTTAATVSLSDNDIAAPKTVTIAATTQAAEPSTNGLFTISLSQTSTTNTVVAYSVAGTATAGTDYTTLTGTVTILAGQLSATVPVTVLDDTLVEGSETVIVTLTSLTGAPDVALGTTTVATVSIADNDTPPAASLTVQAESITTVTGYRLETNGVASGGSMLSLVGGASNETGTATFGFTGASGTYNVILGVFDENDGVSTFQLAKNGTTVGSVVLDQNLGNIGAVAATKVEKTISTGLTLATGDSLTVTGIENLAEHARFDFIRFEAAGPVSKQVSIAATTQAAEPSTNGLFTVSLSQTSSTPTVVAYSVAGTATAGTDYTALTGSLTIPAGQLSATIPVTVLDDTAVEGAESVLVTLTSVTGAPDVVLGAITSATVNIADNDAGVVKTLTIAATTQAAEPSTNGLFTVSLSQTSTTNTVVAYSIGGTATAGSDYTALTGSLTIPAGQLTATVPVTVLDDTLVEGSETIIVTLTGLTGAPDIALGTTTVATVSIADNDTPPAASLTVQAESITTVTGYRLETNGVASGGSMLSLTGGASNETGTATFGFTGATGTYNVILGVFDENDGVSTFQLAKNGSNVGSVILNQNLGSNAAVPATKVEKTIATGLTLATGDSITVTGIEDLAEHARFDFIRFEAAGPVTPQVSIATTQNAAEPSSSGLFTVSLNQALTTNTTVSYSVSGTATAGTDYTTLNGTATILANQLTTVIPLAVLDDALVEGPETVIVTLTGVTGAPNVGLGATTTATATITDNDQSPQTLIFEAEQANNIVNYRVQNIGAASGGSALSLFGGGNSETGSATFGFNEAPGSYNIIIGTFDENDGLASFTVQLNDFETGVTTEIGSLLLNANLGSGNANAQTKISATVATGIGLTPGDSITVNGFENSLEHARLDFLQLVPTI